MDCEMVYTTGAVLPYICNSQVFIQLFYRSGGMRVARVSVVDGSGKEIFDSLVRMDDGVEIVYVKPPSIKLLL
jgi:hypothetical protein